MQLPNTGGQPGFHPLYVADGVIAVGGDSQLLLPRAAIIFLNAAFCAAVRFLAMVQFLPFVPFIAEIKTAPSGFCLPALAGLITRIIGMRGVLWMKLSRYASPARQHTPTRREAQ